MERWLSIPALFNAVLYSEGHLTLARRHEVASGQLLKRHEMFPFPRAYPTSCKKTERRSLLLYGQPTPAAGVSMVSTWPVCVSSVALSIPCHSRVTRNNVLRSSPPSIHAKHPRSNTIVCTTSPPSRTRTQRLSGNSADHTAHSAASTIPTQ